MERVKRFLDEEDMERLKSLKGLRLEHISLAPLDGSDTVLQVIECSALAKNRTTLTWLMNWVLV